MSSTRFMILSLALVAAPAYSVEAQKDDARWLRSCERGDHQDDRERFCEVRHAGFRSTGSIDVTPGTNGGIAIESWDRDSVDVSFRIEAGASSVADARALAGEV